MTVAQASNLPALLELVSKALLAKDAKATLPTLVATFEGIQEMRTVGGDCQETAWLAAVALQRCLDGYDESMTGYGWSRDYGQGLVAQGFKILEATQRDLLNGCVR